MKKLISIIVCIAFILSFFPTAMAASQGNIYYVSPSGSDKNSGTDRLNAWKTFGYAAAHAEAGDTVIFADGTYEERVITVVVNSGTKDAPIVFKSENKHGAVINYVLENSNVNAKLQISEGKEYIEIRDFVFTQETPSESSTSDIMLRVRNTGHCKLVGNKIEKVYEEGIKLSNSIDVLVEGNIITGTGHEGIDSVNSADCVIRGNEIIDCGRTGVMIKGNSRNFLVYNNLVKNTTVEMTNGGYAFTVGGATGIIEGTTLVDYETGFEAYNCVFYNNVIYGSDKKIKTGFAYIGAKDCYCYNNTIVGVSNGFLFGNNGGIANGWGWNAGNLNPVIKNNIVSDATRAFDMVEEPENLVSDFNLYYNITNEASIPEEENGAEGNPMFFDSAADWKIPSSSPAAKMGVTLPSEVDAFPGYEAIEGVTEGKKLPIERTDFSGAARKTPYDIGAYNRETVKTTDLIYEDFETGTVGEDVIGWNGWINKNTSKPNDSYFKIQRESDTESNLVGEITRTNSNGSSVQFIPARNIKAGASSGKFNVFRFRLRSDHPKTQAVVVSLYSSENKSLAMTLYFNNSRVFFGSKNKYIKSGALDTGKWYNFEMRLNMPGEGNTGTLLLDGEELFTNEAISIKDISFVRLESSRNMGTTSTDHDGTTVVASIKFDDFVVSSVGDMEVLSVKPVSEDDLYTAEITFSNDVDADTLSKSDILVNNGAVEVLSVKQVKGNARKCIVTFSEALELETEYQVNISGVSDMYGNSLDYTETTLRTRDRRFNLDEIKFYRNYKEAGQEEIFVLENGNITAAFDVLNEKEDKYEAVLIMVHKRGGKIIGIKAEDASVEGEKEDQKSVTLPISGVTDSDAVEVYLWNSFAGMKPINGGKVLTTQSVTNASEGAEAELSSVNVKTEISGATDDSGKMKLEGNALFQEKGVVTAYVLKPGYKPSEVTSENFTQAVDFVGQKNCEADGSYSFEYDMQGAENATVYNAYAGGNGIELPAASSITFFGSDFIEDVIRALSGAKAKDISKMLAEEIYVPGVTPSVYLNTVLNLDLTAYNSLKDYTEKENFKTAVSDTLEKEVFSDIESIRTVFEKAVGEQKEKQNKCIWLLNEINKSLWSKLAQIFQENKELLQLDWDGSYSKIKSDRKLVEKLYKKLESIEFADFDALRHSFEYEASILKEELSAPPTGNGGGGGGGSGGGGGKIEYSPELEKKADTAKPVDKEKEVEKEAVKFDDIDSVPWAKASIEHLAANNIINGVAKGKFSPDSFVTREQFVKMVILAMNLHNEDAITEKFIDAEKRGWYNSYIASATELGIVHGIDNEHFGIGIEITRAEMAAIVCRAAAAAGKKLESGTEPLSYTDGESIPDYAREYVNILGNAGIMNGVGEGRFAPRDKATRAMAAKVIHLLMEVK